MKARTAAHYSPQEIATLESIIPMHGVNKAKAIKYFARSSNRSVMGVKAKLAVLSKKSAPTAQAGDQPTPKPVQNLFSGKELTLEIADLTINGNKLVIRLK